MESYLGSILPELASAGHEVAFWHEGDEPMNREQIPLPAGVPSWSVADAGHVVALDALKSWRPDLLYSHGLLDPRVEAATLAVAPAVFFAHNYYGTCVSGTKTFRLPVARPCERTFGAGCLAHYYPRRCGGWSPRTMLREYRRQAARLRLLRRYQAIVTHSAHIREELVRHGLAASSAYKFPYYVRGSDEAMLLNGEAGEHVSAGRRLPLHGAGGGGHARQLSEGAERRLLFLGRMDELKGGGVLLDALPRASQLLRAPLSLTLAGDGPARSLWERKAGRLAATAGGGGVRVEFTGWVDGERIAALLDETDLLVLPSLWPEPFGLVGPEAGLRGVPAAAFDVGGVRDWLTDGVNGRLAPGDPPTAGGLAEAVADCLRDPARHAGMRRAAVRLARRFNMKNHLDALFEVFRQVLAQRTGAHV